MEDDQESGLFAIPDFWKRSTWQQDLAPSCASDETQDGFFNLTIRGMATQH